MRGPLLILLAVLVASCGGEDGTPGEPAPIDYTVSITTGTPDIFGANVEWPVIAVVRLPSGAFAHDVTVKWEANLGSYPDQSTTGPDSASTIFWSYSVPTAVDGTIRACATSPVDRVCTIYSGTITVNSDGN